MVKENPNKESCKERMKELIRVRKLNRNQVVKRCMREFDGVHKSTYYGWYDEVINEPDIVSWEEDRKAEFISEYQIKIDLMERMFNRNMEQYDKYCDEYENKEDEETLEKIEKYDIGLEAIREQQLQHCFDITNLQKEIDKNPFEKSVETMRKNSNEEMLSKKYDRLFNKNKKAKEVDNG